MTLQSSFRAAHDAIMTAHSDLTVIVSYNGKTCTGTQATINAVSTLDADGETGLTSGQVRVNADDIDEPIKGATITISGKDCFVLSVLTDGVGAFYVIGYSEQRPVEFSADDVQ